jgi:hypothetical protein
VEKAGQVLDGSAFAEKKIAIYQNTEDGLEAAEINNKAGESFLLITIDKYPMMKLRCSAPNENGEIYLVSLEYLGGSEQGWNEYTLDLSGHGSFTGGENPELTINREIENVQISKGRIHRFDTRITGTEALTALRNRHERIAAIVEWMISLEEQNRLTIKDFEKYWKPFLFPELVSKKKRPALWEQEGDAHIKNEDIRWNVGYTERVFPEQLWPVRNSGTLLRDWEDALSWIYLEYEWENIKEMLSRRIILQRKK